MEKKCAAVTAEISRLTRDEDIGFARLFDSMTDKAYSWKLRAPPMSSMAVAG